MAFTLNASIGLAGTGSLNLGKSFQSLIAQFGFGTGQSIPSPPVGFVTGTGTTLSSGALQGNNICLESLTIAGSGHYDFCFSGGADLDPSGAALAFTAVKFIGVVITAIAGSTLAPNGVDLLQIGPQAVANSAQLWFGGTGATVYESTYWHLWHPGPAAGWTVNSSTASLMRLNNPGSNAITCAILVIGK